MEISDRGIRKALGRRLAALRRSRGLVQEDMRAWNINPRYYARVERGEVNVSFEKLYAISLAFGAPLSQIFLLPLSSSSGSAANVDDLLSALTPLVRSGNEQLVDSLTKVICEFSRGIERGGALSADIAYARKKREERPLRAAQPQRPYRKKGSKRR
jgi:transcriptional regulator with XRE-family HTH domain